VQNDGIGASSTNIGANDKGALHWKVWNMARACVQVLFLRSVVLCASQYGTESETSTVP
jgi:hypothetical protein